MGKLWQDFSIHKLYSSFEYSGENNISSSNLLGRGLPLFRGHYSNPFFFNSGQVSFWN